MSLALPSLLLTALLLASSAPARAGARPIEFVDVTREAGIRWGFRALAPGALYLVETMGGGGGFLDYDSDGDLDIYLVCYTQTPQPDPAARPGDALYRNNGDGTFTDVTERAGLAHRMRGMGLAVGDYDADGFPDIYITGYGESRLYRNQRDGTFKDVTGRAGVGSRRWGASAAFFDYDGDGRLDLYVTNYIDFDPARPTPCQFFEGRPYCPISKFRGSPPALYRNRGDGTFEDVSAKSGVARSVGKGLGVVTLDYDGDGRPDIYQANDADPNFLFRNNGDGTFTETTYPMGLARESIPMSGFGTRFFDYDNDGRTDLFVLNGHPFEPIAKVTPGVTYAEPPLLYESAGRSFREVAAARGAALRRHYLGRGLAVGDYDNDGDPDLLLMNAGEPPALLRNEGGNRNNWLGVRLIGTKSNRDAIGARVTVTAGGTRRSRHLLGGTSYCSASDPRLLFGLGAATRVDELEVRWPSGLTSTLRNLEAGRYVPVVEGAARTAAP
jgi:enediyne biosynthesis protein E4